MAIVVKTGEKEKKQKPESPASNRAAIVLAVVVLLALGAWLLVFRSASTSNGSVKPPPNDPRFQPNVIKPEPAH